MEKPAAAAAIIQQDSSLDAAFIDLSLKSNAGDALLTSGSKP
jgi:hypothetical protein